MSAPVDRRAALAGIAGSAIAVAAPAAAAAGAAAPDPLLELGRRWADAGCRSAEANAIHNRLTAQVHPDGAARLHPFVKWGGDLHSDAASIEAAFRPLIDEYGDGARALCAAVVAEQRRRADALAAAEAAVGLPEASARCEALDEEVGAIEAEILAATPTSVGGVAVMLRVAMTWDGICDGSAVEIVRDVLAKLPAGE